MKRVHNDPGQPRSNASGSAANSRLPIGKNYKAGEQDNLYISNARSSGMIRQSPEPSLNDRYIEKQK
jgi:hypothetical protein